ncbi:hypothetical protein [Aureivirga sp. CE67]|uniref:hypothetical protein n=1 Tax=Aureivirga sp. CE67 TaxID=1788983 RepID=UPI0018C9B63A|nr:hypothetical protein [Aureivirga sp. CE67]
MKKYLLLFLIIFTSCKNEHKEILEDYVQEDLKYIQSKIDYKILHLKEKEKEQPRAYFESHLRSNLFTELISQYEPKILKSENKDSINVFLSELESKIDSSFKESYYPQKIKEISEKYDLLRKLKTINSKYIESRFGIKCFIIHQKSSISSMRLTDSTVLLNITSGRKDLERQRENVYEFYIYEISDVNKKRIEELDQEKNILDSYIIETKSDILNIDAFLKMNENPDFSTEIIDTTIVVGTKTFFK